MLFTIIGKADTFNVTTPGTLEQLVNNADNDSITELTVKGTINWKDLKFIRSCDGRVKALQVIDLTDVEIEESEDSCYSVMHIPSDMMFYDDRIYFYYSNDIKKINKQVGSTYISTHTHYYSNDLGGLFYGMEALHEVRLPKGISNIGNRMCLSCPSLEKVILPTTNMKYIGTYAFSDCEKLKMELPNSVDSIGYGAFDGCESMVGELDLSNVKYKGNNAFDHCGFSKVIISPYLEEIDDFDYCDSLTTIVFPSNGVLKTIGGFQNCNKIASVTIPNSVTEISGSAFQKCKKLLNVTVPSSVTEIGGGSFADTPYYESLKDDKGFYVLNKILLKYKGDNKVTEIATPQNVETITSGCEWENTDSLKKLVLSERVKVIGSNALPAIQELIIPESVDSIGYYALSNVGTLYYNAVNAKFNFGRDLSYFYNYVFDYNCCADEVIFGEKLKTIPTGLLTVTRVSKVTLPQSLKTIEPYAFYNTRIESIDIPESVDSIGDYAFAQTLLKSVYCNASRLGVGIFSYSGFFYNAPLTDVVFGDKVEAIPNYMCKGAYELTSVTFPSQLKKIGDGAFYKTKIKDKVFPETLNYIGKSAFENCDSLKHIMIPDAVTYIGSQAFAECDSLKEINIPENVEYLGYGIIKFCKNLNTVYYNAIEAHSDRTGGAFEYFNVSQPNVIIGNKVKVIPDRFLNGTKIASIKLPSSLKEIGTEAFAGSMLEQIEIPESVDSIGDCAFANCKRLKTANIPLNVRTLSHTFQECDSLSTIYYNASNATVNLSSTTFFNYDMPFYHCTQLKNIVFGETVESIPQYLFRFLETDDELSLKLPSSLKVIGKSAFQSMNATTIEIPANSSLTTIGEMAFYGSKISSISLPETVDSIGTSAFGSCEELREVTVPKNVKSLYGTFNSCDSLSTVYYNAVNATTYYYTVDNVQVYDWPFRTCYNIKKFVVGKGVERLDLALYGKNISEVEFKDPESLRYIDDSFAYSVWRSNLPEGVNYVGKVAVAYNAPSSSSSQVETCASVQENVIDIKEGTVSLAGGFAYGQDFTSVNFPQSLTTIGTSAFRNCLQLKTIILPDNITALEYNVFSGCGNLSSVELPKYITEISGGLFYECSSIANIVIPDSVTSIGYNAFCGCSSLATITLPKNLKEVASTFISYNSGGIKDIYCPVIEPAAIMYGSEIMHCYGIKLHVYPESESAYCNATGWKDFNVVGDLKNPSGIANAAINETDNAISVSDSAIIVAGNDDLAVSVYSVDGQCIYRGKADRIPVNPGLYVVKVGGKTQTVIVR